MENYCCFCLIRSDPLEPDYQFCYYSSSTFHHLLMSCYSTHRYLSSNLELSLLFSFAIMLDLPISSNSPFYPPLFFHSLLVQMKVPIGDEKYEFEANSHEISITCFIGLVNHFSIKATAFYAIFNRWFPNILPVRSKQMQSSPSGQIWPEQIFRCFYLTMSVVSVEFRPTSCFLQ